MHNFSVFEQIMAASQMFYTEQMARMDKDALTDRLL